MGHKLNIIPREYNNTGWHKSRQFNVPEIQKVKIDGAGKGSSLNSIPSPFARMHLFETAFEMVFQDLVNNTKFAGDTYNKLVSDCFDVFELIFNWESHVKEGKPLKVSVWKRDEEILMLKNSSNKSHKLLGETLEAFLKGEAVFSEFESCLIIKFDDKVIGGTSPFTGFFTTPDNLRNFNLLKPLSQIAYFSRIIDFKSRKPEVRKYIFDFFETNPVLQGKPFTSAIRDYLDFQKNAGLIPSGTSGDLTSFKYNNSSFTVFGEILKVAKSIGTEFFEPNIIRLNYQLNNECFFVPELEDKERKYDYLLPIRPSYIQQTGIQNLRQNISFRETEPGQVEVTIKLKGNSIKKTYQLRPIHDQDGKIIDISDENSLNIHVEIFPFLKIIDQPEGTNYNDFYKVMFSVKSFRDNISNKDFNLSFIKEGSPIENGALYSIKRNERTILNNKPEDRSGSIYYSLNTFFDGIQVELPSNDGGTIKGMIIPKWKEKSLGTKQIDFSIDFGTTSTFIAYSDSALQNIHPKPFEFTVKELPVAQLHNKKAKTQADREIDCFEIMSLTVFNEAIDLQKKEFVPSIIQKGQKYEFPIRTVLYQKPSLRPNEKEALGTSNICFVYNKPDIATISSEQQFVPNLKWNIKSNADFESSVRVFIEEIYLLIRTKILLNEGDPSKARIFWFSPLSFTSASKRSYSNLWNTLSAKYLKNDSKNVINLTESEAPFYYLSKNATINNHNLVLTLDVGGGSTDIMVFNQNKPVLGTSVHFGANVLWGNGFSEFTSEKENGIFQAIKKEISENLINTDLEKLNEAYCSDEYSNIGSDEIINFWIENDDKTKVVNKLNNGDFRLSYLLHLSALIYHTLKLLKTKHLPAPTCIIFSGNGSKYVDLIHGKIIIEKIWAYFIKEVFEIHQEPQVILPTSNRKEATCYGGLFAPQPQVKFTTDNYIGFESSADNYLKYKDIEENKDSVLSKLLISINEFIDLFFKMNAEPELNFRNQFGIENKLDQIQDYLKSKAAENLNVGYVKRLNQVDLEDAVSDSMFYYPFIGLIFKMNKLSEAPINQNSANLLYASTPDGEKEFLIERISSTKKPESIFSLSVNPADPNKGKLFILDEPLVHKRALSVYQGNLDPVCSYHGYPQPGKSIKIISPGEIEKEEGKWIVKKKIEIEFI
jgi:hypothetical protein